MRNNLVSHCQDGTADKIYMHCVRRNSNGTYAVVGKWGRRGQRSLAVQVKGVFQTEADAVAEQKRLHYDMMRINGYVDIESSSYDGPLTMTDRAVKDNLEGGDMEQPGRTLDIAAGQRYTITAPGKRKRFVSGPNIVVLKANEEASKGVCNCGNDTFKSVVDKSAKRVMVCASCGKVWGFNGRSMKKKDYDEDVVTCLDNTGIEDKFDEGIEYVSENHDDPSMIYVYDRLGNKQECFSDRFEKTSPYKHLETDIQDTATPVRKGTCESCKHSDTSSRPCPICEQPVRKGTCESCTRFCKKDNSMNGTCELFLE